MGKKIYEGQMKLEFGPLWRTVRTTKWAPKHKWARPLLEIRLNGAHFGSYSL